jgi:hypothetical protein
MQSCGIPLVATYFNAYICAIIFPLKLASTLLCLVEIVRQYNIYPFQSCNVAASHVLHAKNVVLEVCPTCYLNGHLKPGEFHA